MYTSECLSFFWCWLFLHISATASSRIDIHCASFATDHVRISTKTNSAVNLAFSLTNNCGQSMKNINVRESIVGSADWFIICSIEFANGRCDPTPGCRCDQQPQQYSVSRRLNDSRSREWELFGKLQNGREFREFVHIHVTPDYTTGTRVPWDTPLPGYVSSSTEASTSSMTTEDIHTTSTDVTSTHRQAFDAGSTSKSNPNGDIPRDFNSVVVVVPLTAVVVVFVMILSMCWLKRNIQGLSTRSASNGCSASDPTHNVWPSQVEISNAVYRGPNVSLMISNELYGESPNTSTTPTSLSDDKRAGMPLPPIASENVTLDMADRGASPVLVRSGSGQRPRMPLPPEAFQTDTDTRPATVLPCDKDGDYTDIDSLRGDGDESVDANSSDEMDLYMDIDEIRKKRAGKKK